MIKLGCILELHEKENACWNCCEQCNLVQHQCPGCGNDLTHDGRDVCGKNKGKFHIDCIGEWNIVDGIFRSLTEFGKSMDYYQQDKS